MRLITIIFTTLFILSVGFTQSISLEERVSNLEQRVKELERIIAKYEKGIESGQIRKPTTGDWRKKSNWRQLKKGMTKEQVRSLLGEPSKVTVSTYHETWIYGDFLLPCVEFDNRGFVKGWQE